MLETLFIFLIMMIFISYFLCEGEIIAPLSVSCISYTISCLFAMILGWRYSLDIEFNTIVVIALSIITFAIGDVFVRYIEKRKNKLYKTLENDEKLNKEPIKITNINFSILLMINIIVAILMLKEIYRISIIAGNPGGYSEMFAYYRNYISFNAKNSLDTGASINIIVSQMMKFSIVSGYIYIYIYLYNKIRCNRPKANKKLIILILTTCIVSLLTGGRLQLLYYMCAAISMGFMLSNIQFGWNKNVSKDYFKVGLKIILISLPIFYILATIVGRDVGQIKFIDYISVYAGGSILGLDDFIKYPIYDNSHFATETLREMYKLLYRLKIGDFISNAGLEFRNVGPFIGNVYTGLRRYIHDYGYMGMLIIQFLFGVTCSKFYFYIRNKNKHFTYILYGMLVYAVFLQSIEEYFIRTIFTVNTATQIIIAMFIYCWIFRVKIKIK